MYSINQLKNELEKRYNHNIELDLLEKYIHIWHIEPDIFHDEEMYFDETSLHMLHRGLKLQDNGFNDEKIPEILEKTSYISETNNSIDDYVYEKVEQTISKLREEGRLKFNEDLKAGEELKQALIKRVKSKAELLEKEINKTKFQTNPAKGHNIQKNAEKVIQMKPAKPEVKPENAENKIKKVEPKTENTKPKANNTTKSANTDKLVEKLSEKVSDKVSGDILQYLQDDKFLEKIMSMGTLKRDNEILSKQVVELINANSALEEKVFSLELENRNFQKIWGKLFFYLGDKKKK